MLVPKKQHAGPDKKPDHVDIQEQQEQPADGYETEQPQAQAAPGEQEAASSDDSVAQLTQLKSLLDSGALTQQEFDAEKQKIIGG